MRFFLPVVPFLSIISAYILTSIAGTKKVMSTVLYTVLCLLLTFPLALSVYRNIDSAKVVLGIESEDNYLTVNERSFSISKYINETLAPSVKVMVVNEPNTFYVDRPHKRELYWWIFTRYDKKYESPEEIMSALKADGYSHVLYASYETDDGGYGKDLRITKLMKKESFKRKFLEEIYSEDSSSKNSGGVKYILYQIK